MYTNGRVCNVFAVKVIMKATKKHKVLRYTIYCTHMTVYKKYWSFISVYQVVAVLTLYESRGPHNSCSNFNNYY